jgi:general secretion pathway protein D
MKHVMLALVLFTALFVQAEIKIKMNFKNEELVTIIEKYSKASNQKFIIDPIVRGKVTLLLPNEVSLEEAYNHISSALAINGYAISTQDDTKVVRAARNIQRDLIEVGNTVPSIKPERMYSWVYQLQVASADSVLKQFRNITSKDGEIMVYENNNQLIITDWTSNINRIAALLKEIDIKANTKK